MHYKYIFCYETKLQKRIIDKLISKLQPESFLCINALGHELKIEDNTFKINFNKPKLWFESFKELGRLKALDLSADYFAGTIFTGHNALFLSSYFKKSEYILIDDGIGTPVQLNGGMFLEKKIKFRIKHFFLKALLSLNNIKYLSMSDTLENIKYHYCIYKGYNYFSHTKYVDLIDEKIRINEGVLFIGSPLVEFNIMSQKNYLALLQKIKTKYGDIKYYPHPDEVYMKNVSLPGIEVIESTMNVEEYIIENGARRIMISFSSSAMLNMANYFKDQKNAKFISIKVDKYDNKYDNYYYQFEKAYGIETIKML